VAGYHFLTDAPLNPDKAPEPNDVPPPFNGPVHILSKIATPVLASAAEAEFAGLYRNGQEGCTLRTTLIEMGHPQLPTHIKIDNSTAAGIANDTVKQRRSIAIDMRYYWIRDCVRQGQFIVHWKRGANNDADYFSKHHAPAHYRRMRSRYLYEGPPSQLDSV
jgi:hypothetical protein